MTNEHLKEKLKVNYAIGYLEMKKKGWYDGTMDNVLDKHTYIHIYIHACIDDTHSTHIHIYWTCVHFFVRTYVQEPLKLRFDTAMTMLRCYNATMLSAFTVYMSLLLLLGQN